ncbi:hypothetical protein MRX96_055405 [Rhipicephalus microplus]
MKDSKSSFRLRSYNMIGDKGNFQSASSEQLCASMSGSFQEALLLDPSSVHAKTESISGHDEDFGEMSIC